MKNSKVKSGSKDEFNWFVGTSQNALLKLTDIPIREFYLDPNACIEAYRKGRDKLRELFGSEVPSKPISTPMIKYGHLNTLGAQLDFPEGGEPHFKTLFESAEQGLKHLQNKVDFAGEGMSPFYLDFYKKMQQVFVDEKVHWGWQWEGPITTAWGLLGNNFMYDLFDKPEITKQFLELTTISIVDYCRFFCETENTEYLDTEPDHGRLCDDIAAMVPPRLWKDIVLPYWKMFFQGPVPGRIVHCEDMKPDHLRYLEQIKICDYDPGISLSLNPRIIKKTTPVKFGWRLSGFNYDSMSCRDVEDFIYQAVADGASYCFTYIEAAMCNQATAEKVRAFVAAADRAKQMLDGQTTRDEIGQCVSGIVNEKYGGKAI